MIEVKCAQPLPSRHAQKGRGEKDFRFLQGKRQLLARERRGHLWELLMEMSEEVSELDSFMLLNIVGGVSCRALIFLMVFYQQKLDWIFFFFLFFFCS